MAGVNYLDHEKPVGSCRGLTDGHHHGNAFYDPDQQALDVVFGSLFVNGKIHQQKRSSIRHVVPVTSHETEVGTDIASCEKTQN